MTNHPNAEPPHGPAWTSAMLIDWIRQVLVVCERQGIDFDEVVRLAREKNQEEASKG